MFWNYVLRWSPYVFFNVFAINNSHSRNKYLCKEKAVVKNTAYTKMTTLNVFSLRFRPDRRKSTAFRFFRGASPWRKTSKWWQEIHNRYGAYFSGMTELITCKWIWIFWYDHTQSTKIDRNLVNFMTLSFRCKTSMIIHLRTILP